MVEQDEEILADLLLNWEESHEQGKHVSVAELCQNCQHLADELARRIHALKTVAWLDRPIDNADDDPAPTESPQHDPRILAGRYRLDRLVAEGGFAQVWRGFDQELHRYVAIKLPKPNRIHSADAFIAEARRVASLKHPGIVPVHDVGRENGVCFIVSEFVEGSSLADIIGSKSFTQEQAIRWIAEIADALQQAHASGIVHQDVKPANILIDQHARALLTDFGIANSEMKTGTLSYMSPEQLDGKKVNAQSDIYSLGVVLHELLVGNQPYSSAEPLAVRKDILSGVSLGRSATEYRRIFHSALQQRADARYETAAQMANDLRSLISPKSSPSRLWLVALTLLMLVLISPLLWNSLRSTAIPQQPRDVIQVGEIGILKGGPQVISVAFSPDGQRVLTGELFQSVSLWNAKTGERIKKYRGLKDWVRCVAYAPDGRWVIAGSGGNDDGTGTLATGPHSMIIRWNIDTCEEEQRFGPIDAPITTVAISATGDAILSGSDDGMLRLWDSRTGQIQKTIAAHSSMIRSVKFMLGKPWALSCGGDSMIRIWDLESEKPIRELSGHRDMVESVDCSPDGKFIVSGGKDNTVRIWDSESGQEIRRLEGHAYHVRSVCFSPDGRSVLSGGFDGTVRLWDTATGLATQIFAGHKKGITSVAFSPDGKRVISGSVDGTARLWALPQMRQTDDGSELSFGRHRHQRLSEHR